MGRWREFIGKTFYQAFEEAALKYPEREALVFKDQRVNYRDYLDNVNRFARGLRAIGVKKEDHVAVWMSNRLEWVYTKWAIDRLGATLVPINTRYKAEELAYILDQSDSSTLLMEDRFLGKYDGMAILREILPELATSQPGDLQAEKIPLLRNVVCWSNEVHTGCFSPEDFFGRAATVTDEETRVEVSPEANHAIMYTSGTTGSPKGVVLSHRSHLACFAIIAELIGLFKGGARMLGGTAPFFGNIGLSSFCRPAITGNTAVLMESFEPEECLRLVDQEKCTILITTPTMLLMILEHPDLERYNVNSLRVVFSGGAVLPRKLVRACHEKLGVRTIMNGYGLVEGSGVTSWVGEGASMEEMEDTVGKPLPYCEVAILDTQTGEKLPPGQRGEICTREVIPGCHFMKGYYKKPEETVKTIRNGYLHSGDLGMIREDGNLQITGRLKDMYLVGGFNVYPAEVEDFLLKHPKIKQVSVVGVPDRRLGEVGAAFVQLREGERATEAEIIEVCKGKMANIKVPRYVMFVDEFPMNPQGKIQKFKLRDMGIKQWGLGEE